ncbi:MAG: LPXTG cell wall anchor domain-containing protein [Clostridium sp.]|nr:LPXTG cell wall anchor domain-containing protein [Clostridium sp.]
MKKFFALCCAGVLAFSLSLTAFAANSPQTTYTPNTGDSKADFDAVVSTWEKAKFGNTTGTAVVNAMTADEQAGLKEYAASLGLAQQPFAYANVQVVGYVSGLVTITFNLNNIRAGDNILVLHQVKAGQWENITPDRVGNGTVTVTFSSLSPVAFVYGEEATAEEEVGAPAKPGITSPKTGDTSVLFLAVLGVMALAGTAAVGRKTFR